MVRFWVFVVLIASCENHPTPTSPVQTPASPNTKEDAHLLVAPVECVGNAISSGGPWIFDRNVAVSCGSDKSLAAAMESYSRIRPDLDRCKPSPGRILDSDCESARTVLLRHVCGEVDHSRYYFWAPLEVFVDGEAAFLRLNEYARSGKPFFDNEAQSSGIRRGHIIVEAAEITPSERHFALCDIRSVGGQIGPPESCGTVAIVTPRQTWLRGGDPLQDWCEVMATFRPTGAIEIRFKILTNIDLTFFSESLTRMLIDDLTLATVRTDFSSQRVPKESSQPARPDLIDISATAGVRNSKILSGWRETMDFDVRVNIDNDRATSQNAVAVLGVAHVMTVQQAVGNLTQYHGLSDGQRNTYATALDQRVRSALTKVCPKKSTIADSKTILCE